MENSQNVVLALPAPSVNNNDIAMRSMKSLSEDANAAQGKQKRSVFLINCKPLWGCSSVRGRRSQMEDAYIVVPGFIEVPIWMLTKEPKIEGIDNVDAFKVTAHFFGVYDGHGGTQVANYCRDRIHLALTEELNKIEAANSKEKINFDLKKKWERAFTHCFQKVDEESMLVAPETVGSTALVVLVSSSHIIVANCGHSRAVLSRGKQAIPLSLDHKPKREEEYARIEAEGGKFVLDLLAMSRSLGDDYLKPWIIPVPEITKLPRAKDDNCLILASDGLWDVVSNEEACDLARKKIMVWRKKNGTMASSENLESYRDRATQSAAESLLKLALLKGSKDNITVMVVDLKPLGLLM
ncbi:putative protein phosphatase 2C 6 [Carex rostrata]